MKPTGLSEVLLWVSLILALRTFFYFTLQKTFHSREGSIGLLTFVLISAYVYWIMGCGMGVFKGLPVISVGAASALFYFLRKEKSQLKDMDWISEFLFWGTFAFAIFVRMYSPYLDFGEKYSDLMIFQSVLNAKHFPPQDLWLSGHTLNYYYFSHLFFVPFVKLLHISPEVAFHLVVCTVTALTVSSFYDLLRSVETTKKWSVFGAISGFYCANWEFFRTFGVFAKDKKPFWWWDSSRAITNTITEFPYFSFLLGDFHAHFTAFPFLTLSLFLILNLKKTMQDSGRYICIFLCALSVGVHYPANPWGLPLMALLTVVLLLKNYKHWMSVGVLSFLLFLPFWLTYQRPSATTGLFWVTPHLRSALGEFILHWAFFFGCFLLLAVMQLRRLKNANFLFFLFFSSLLVSMLGGWPCGLAGALMGISIQLHWDKKFSLENILFCCSCLILIFCEMYSIDVTYGEQYFRMNTVFKFYMFAWWMFALSVAIMWHHLFLLLNQTQKKMCAPILFVFVSLSLVYPIRATPQRMGEVWSNPRQASLSGMVDWNTRFPGEADMIQWMREKTSLQSVIWELYGPGYSRYARVSTFAGRPTVVGWLSHQQVWRKDGYPLAQKRIETIEALYKDHSHEKLKSFLQEYKVNYVVVGQMEKEVYPETLLKLIEIYPVAFSNETVAVYQVQ